MAITAKIIEDSISTAGKRITTFQLLYPRLIHSELMTHRVFSRNASSSRAIPVQKMIDMVRSEPAMPIHWGKNQPGMQAKEQLTGELLEIAKGLWLEAASCAARIAGGMDNIGLHKQIANRILEPFQHISVVLTATEFSNWFELRAHTDAQPEIHELAIQMRIAMEASQPKLLWPGAWHLPYVTSEDWHNAPIFLCERGASDRQVFEENDTQVLELLKKVSAARCCRVSYLTHEGRTPSIEDDLDLCDKLVGAKPLHASPFEHIATPDSFAAHWANPHLHGNFPGWIQYRKLIENSFK